jgi:hypothetical protein
MSKLERQLLDLKSELSELEYKRLEKRISGLMAILDAAREQLAPGEYRELLVWALGELKKRTGSA